MVTNLDEYSQLSIFCFKSSLKKLVDLHNLKE